MRFGTILAAICLASAFAPASLAQNATLYCSGDEAIVRFDSGDENYPLPAKDSSRWENVTPADGNRCKLSNGREVVMRFRQTQSTPFGASGANREAVFSLWVDRKKIVSREEFFPHPIAAPHKRRASHTLYSMDALELCRYAEGDEYDNRTENISCERRSVDLSQLNTDPLEPKDDSNLGVITIASALSTEFCESFVVRKGLDVAVSGDGNIVHLGTERDADRLAIGTAGQTLPFGYRKGRSLEVRDHVFRIAELDVLNSGSVQTIVEFVGTSGAFYGNFFMIRDGAASDADIRRLIDLVRLGYRDPVEIRRLNPDGWQMLQAGPDKWTEHTIIVQSGRTFILAKPFIGQSVSDAALFLLGPGYQTSFPICTFQSVWPNL